MKNDITSGARCVEISLGRRWGLLGVQRPAWRRHVTNFLMQFCRVLTFPTRHLIFSISASAVYELVSDIEKSRRLSKAISFLKTERKKFVSCSPILNLKSLCVCNKHRVNKCNKF